MCASRHRLPAFCDFCLQPNAMNNAERCHDAQLGRPVFTRHTWLYTWRVTEVAVEVWFSCCWLLDPAGGRLRSASSEAQRGLARTLSWWSRNKWHLALLCIESSQCDSWRPKLCVCPYQMWCLCCSAACRAAEVLTDRSDDHTRVVKVVGLLSLLVGGESLGGNFHSSHTGPKAVKMFERQQNEILKSLPLCNFIFFQFLGLFLARAEWKDSECGGLRGLDKHWEKWDRAVSLLNPDCVFVNVHVCLNKALLNGSYRARTSWNIELNISNISWK